jgi:uncharacterized phage protein (TIGR02218 family)
MRPIPAALAARLASGVTTLAHVWLITRRDGDTFGFTDHDRPLALDGVVCEPMTGAHAGVAEKSLGLSVDTASISGALASEAISEEDLARGLWDGARVDLLHVDWTDPTLRVHLFAGHLGEVRRGVRAFEAELRGLQAQLNAPVGRVFSRFCDAELADQRCGVSLDAPAYRGEGAVAEVLSNSAFRASGLVAFDSGWFARGRLAWSAGGEGLIATHRREGDTAVIELLNPAGAVLAPAATFVVFAGCDKRIETCRAKFANGVNFRGFPHMPGNDAVQSGPVANERMDGSSRFS